MNQSIQAGLLSKTEGLDKYAQKVRRSYGRQTVTATEPLAANKIRIFYAAMLFTAMLYLDKRLLGYDFDKFLLSSL